MYYNLDSTVQNYTLALEYYLKAAELDPSSAQCYEIGYMYQYGYGTEQNDDKALEWYSKAIEDGSRSGVNAVGVIYDKQGNEKAAYEHFLKAAEMGNKTAMRNLGNYYYQGNYVEQDYASAFEWYKKAEEAGLEHNAMFYCMGWMCHNGKGTTQNDITALHYYEKAEAMGNLNAMTALGVLYETSNVIPRDYKRAYEYCEKAAQQGNVGAYYRLGRMYLYGNDVISQNNQMAVEYLTVAAEGEYQDAARYLAEAYLRQGKYPQALPLLEGIYEHVQEGPHNMSDDSMWFVLEWLGSIYNSHVDPPDYEKAMKYYSEASSVYESGYALMMLGRYYLEGTVVEQNLEIAKEMFETAVERGETRAQQYLDALLEAME